MPTKIARPAPSVLVANAVRLGHNAQTAALAIVLAAGVDARALCVWCAESEAPEGATDYRVNGGDCSCCKVSGRDVLVVVPS